MDARSAPQMTAPRWIVDVMRLHALEQAPLECCGLLAGPEASETEPTEPAAVVDAIFPLENEARSETEFHAGAGLFAPFKQMRADSRQLVAIYHSHPTSPPVPSETDLERNHYPDSLHCILSPKADRTVDIGVFQLREQGFRAVPLRIVETPAGDRQWLELAIQLSRLCPKAERSFAVGAVIVGKEGEPLATGYSLELGDGYHAEHSALEKATAAGADVRGATMYSSLEPCSVRLSGKTPCVERILAAGIARTVFALSEPPVFVRCEGENRLRAAGVEVEQVAELAEQVRAINRHVMPSDADLKSNKH